jgi:hypothetical protein
MTMSDCLIRIGAAALISALALPGCAGVEAATEVGDDAPAGIDYDVVIELTSVVVPPGGEAFYCQYVPASGVDRWFSAFDGENGPMCHHMTPYRVHDPTRSMPARGPFACTSVTTPPGTEGMLPGFVEADTMITLPEGVAIEVTADEGLFFNEHWLNTSSETLVTHPVWRAATIPRERVTHPAGLVKLAAGPFVVPAESEFVEEAGCRLDADVSVVAMFGHMHHLGVEFDASIAGVPRYQTGSWDSPKPAYYDPPLPLGATDALGWSCHYENTTPRDVHEGPSASKDEMCVLNAIYYPTPTSAAIARCPSPVKMR